jgi:phosphatidylserine decarboxylase
MADLSYTLLRLLPKNTFSRAMGALLRSGMPRAWHRTIIRRFAKAYKVDVTESEQDYLSYPTFAEFFTRRLKPGSRAIAPGEKLPVSPVDGTLGELGPIENGTLLQAKGRTYTVAELVGGPEAEADAAKFEGGAFVTIYLAPYNYHRIHAPLGGVIEGYTNVPGMLWPVNAVGVRNVEKLFCVNERLTTWLRTPRGPCAVVAVGATNVGRIRAVYDDVVTNARRTRTMQKKIYEKPIPVEKAGELAIFEMGSTVVLLFPKGFVANPALERGQVMRLGMPLEAPDGSA